MIHDYMICNIILGQAIAGQWQVSPKTNIAIANGRISYIGPDKVDAKQIYNGRGRLLTPALIDCHTHLVYGGNRAHEFDLRLNGASYQDIAKQGGGINYTVQQTQKASEKTLYQQAKVRLNHFMQQGVATIEIKSGYGQNIHDELKQLRIARQLAQNHKMRIIPTYLGAHSAPAGADKGQFIAQCISDLDMVKQSGLAQQVDGFCENIGFTTNQCEEYLTRAKQLGFAIKLHSDQLSNIGGTPMAVRLGALSVDHLEYIDESDCQILGNSSTIAVLLPAAFYYLRETTRPPIGLMRQYGVKMAVASDCNPGSSPCHSLLLSMNMASVLWQMTPAEVFCGVTHHAALALGLENLGLIKEGYIADMALWNCTHPNQLIYNIGYNPHHKTMVAGEWR